MRRRASVAFLMVLDGNQAVRLTAHILIQFVTLVMHDRAATVEIDRLLASYPTILLRGVGANPTLTPVIVRLPAPPLAGLGGRGLGSGADGTRLGAIDRRVRRVYRSAMDILAGAPPTEGVRDRAGRLKGAIMNRNPEAAARIDFLRAIVRYPEEARELLPLIRPPEPILFGTVTLCDVPDRITRLPDEAWEREYAPGIEWLSMRGFLARPADRRLTWRLESSLATQSIAIAA